MTHDDFVSGYLQLADVGCEPQTKLVLARVADTTRNGSVSSPPLYLISSLSLCVDSFLYQSSELLNPY